MGNPFLNEVVLQNKKQLLDRIPDYQLALK
jgi:hypothetical protein